MKRDSLRVWASSIDAAVTDPDLDVNHPGGQGGNQKYEHGWVVEKEPHQWANFIYNNVDLSIKDRLENGTLSWESGVVYSKESICVDNGAMFRAIKQNINHRPASYPADWEVIPYESASSLESYIENMYAVLQSHSSLVGPTENAHKTTAAQAGTYTKEESDAKIKIVKDDLDAHKAQSNPHNLDAEDVGTLDKTKGGHFTGVVTYNLVGFSGVGACVDTDGLTNIKDSIGIVGNLPYQKTSGQEIVTDTSYNKIEMRYNPLFALPEPDIRFAFTEGLSSLSEGDYTLSYGRPTTYQYVNKAGATVTAAIDEPPIGQFGLYLTADTVLTFSGLMSGTTATVYYLLNDEVIIKTVSVNSDNLIDYIGTSGQVRDIRIWLKQLTTKQESMLGG